MEEREVLELTEIIQGTADDHTVLEMLQKEHLKFSGSNPEKIRLYVDNLIERGVYPKETVPGNSRTVLEMVSNYGAYWYKWREGTILECPRCKVDLRDLESGPPGVRQIGHVDRGTDRVEFWECPDCHGTWSRGYKPDAT